MDHPIRGSDQLKLRKKLGALIKSKYDLVRNDTIVFVCGGNDPGHARTRFLETAREQLKEYDFFTPESALTNPWQADDAPFELTKFEEIVADVSLAVVVFPESPGSYCETGYFSAKDPITKKMLLAINRDFQADDSFISTGPVNIVNEKSNFRPAQYIDYQGDFGVIIDKIRKRRPERRKKSVSVNNYADLSMIEKMGLIQKIVDILSIATTDDIVFIFRSAFKSHVSESEIKSLIAILRGSQYLLSAEPYGHLYVNPGKGKFFEIRTGARVDESEVIFEIAELIERYSDFNDLLSAAKNAC